jgi:hypothetical protein
MSQNKSNVFKPGVGVIVNIVRLFQNIHSKHGYKPTNITLTGNHFLLRFIL